MKKIFLLAVPFVMGVSLQAQQIDTLESVMVTGTRIPMSLGQSARMVSVLDSVAVSKLPAQTINDILKFSVGVDVRQRGVAGMQTDVSMRGGTFDQVAILLNGVNICDPQTGHNAVDLPVDPREIERIEVLEGPAARVYGTSSLVGAINIVTKDRSGGYGFVEGGSFGYFGAGAAYGGSRGRFASRVSASGARSDGYTRTSSGSLSSDYNAGRAFWQGRVEFPALRLGWHAGISARNFGSNTFYSSKYDDQFEHTLKTYTALSAESKGDIHLKANLWWNSGHDRFELFRGDPSVVPFNYHNTNTFGANVGTYFNTNLGKTAIGAEFRHEGIVSTNLGDPLSHPHGHYVVGLNRSQLGVYVEHSVLLPRLTVSGGLHVAHHSGIRGVSFYPGLDASFRLAGDLKLYASLNSSLRMPTFTDLYYSVGGHKADKNLRPEKMQSCEAGIKWMPRGIRLIATAYYHHGTDMIDWIRDLNDDEPVWQSVNYTVINTFGQEASLRLDMPSLLDRTFILRDIYIAYSHISQDKDIPSNIQSAYALEYLRHKLIAQADFDLPMNIGANISVRYHDRTGSYTPYTLISARITWTGNISKLPGLLLFAEADNLLDRPWYDHGDIPQPGLTLRSGLTVNL